ncbi:hypothetical protein [Streptomyces sp. MH60]|uniref:hypothetical protein n=1 Tax=Streptomyces sp. MH60 TaxID=1940758 RepID=UPI000CEEC903|nr:hypothetical protein [Streptomyces sp. MH60]PPS89548.1 hypothetical protein BZZ08_01695 [Streptomyces sp. MH60]
MSTLDAKLDTLTFEEKLEVARRVHVGSLTLREGDRVQAVRRLRGSYIDEDLEQEGEDCRVPYDVPAGAPGRITLVRRYVSPFPYRVLFDNDVELSLAATGDVERIGDSA